MRELIERYVRELVKIPSTSNTETEKKLRRLYCRGAGKAALL
jgi:translation initiation factor 2 beta subunit (eIF-2beta)/eIF-5